MSFICPLCDTSGTLEITHSIHLPGHLLSWCDELALQVVACSSCGFRGAAVYEESRRGGGDSYHHYCFHAPGEALDALARRISRCPRPDNHRCFCLAHLSIGRRTFLLFGQWAPPIPIN